MSRIIAMTFRRRDMMLPYHAASMLVRTCWVFRMAIACVAMVFAAPTANAQFPYNSTAFELSDNADYRGYSLCLSTFTSNTGNNNLEENGYIAVGNRTGPRDERDSINLIEIPVWDGLSQNGGPSNAPQLGVSFNIGLNGVEELRAVGITALSSNLNPAGAANIAVVCLARTSGAYDKTVVIVLDCSSFGTTPVIVRTYELQLPDGGMYPMGIACSHIVAGTGGTYRNTVYLCGFSTAETGMTYPNDPEFRTSKQAFVAKINVDLDAVSTKFFNTNVNTMPDPNPRDPSRVNDYDAAHRIRWVHGAWLLLSGSCNSTAMTSWPNHPQWQVNTSASWIAQIDTGSLGIIGQDFIGLPTVSANQAPYDRNGVYGVDVNMTGQGAHPYYLLHNRLDRNGWYMSHVDNATVQLSIPGSGDNSFYYTDQNMQAKTSVLLNQLFGVNGLKSPAHRMTIAGFMRDATYLSPLQYANFSVAFEANYSPTTGTSVTSLFKAPIGWFIGSSSPITSMPLDEPYWLRSDLATWCNPDFAAHHYLRNPFSTGLANEEIGFMGPFQRGSTPPNSPKFINADPDGGHNFVSSSCGIFAPLHLYPNNIGTTTMHQMPVDQQELEYVTETVDGSSGLSAILHQPTDCQQYYNTNSSWLFRSSAPKAAANEIRFAPNPVTDILEVNCGHLLQQADMPVSLDVFDLSGKLVMHTAPDRVSGAKAHFNVGSLLPGMYMATITTGSQTSKSTKLFVK